MAEMSLPAVPSSDIGAQLGFLSTTTGVLAGLRTANRHPQWRDHPAMRSPPSLSTTGHPTHKDECRVARPVSHVFQAKWWDRATERPAHTQYLRPQHRSRHLCTVETTPPSHHTATISSLSADRSYCQSTHTLPALNQNQKSEKYAVAGHTYTNDIEYVSLPPPPPPRAGPRLLAARRRLTGAWQTLPIVVHY